MEQATQATIGEVVKQVAAAMSEAVKQYGPDAVDLALMAYRVDAAQQVLHGVAFAVAATAVIIAFVRFWAWSGTKMDGSYNDEPYYIGRGLGGFFAVAASTAFAAAALARLLDVSAWLATFGYPELRIAIRALEAAGLM